MARTGELSLRINFYVAPNESGDEIEQLERAAQAVKGLYQNDHFRFAGFTEAFVHDDVLADGTSPGRADAPRERFLRLARFAAEGGYNLHLNASRDETARQWLDALEETDAVKPLTRQRIAFAGLDDPTPETIARIRRLGGGISVQSRMALTGERMVEHWGLEKAGDAPPLRAMVDSGVSLGAGSDGFQAGNYSPMLTLWWLITGKTVAGSALRSGNQNLTREQALRAHTQGNSWLTFEEGRRGSIEVGKHADLAVLNGDYLTVPDQQLRALESLLTIVGGRVVYAAGPFAQLRPN
jgi:predicted amidohydrolase YtcJ